MLEKILTFLKKHNERATVIGLGLGLVVFVVAGIYLQKKNSSEKEKPPKKEPVKVELRVKSLQATDRQSSSKTTNSFFLRPTPAELLEQLAAMENLQENAAQKKLQYLRVLWPVYFFNLEQLPSGENIVLDISEDGFGVAVRGVVNSSEYPQLQDIKVGEKVWVAGEISAVDPSGTGTVHLNIELLDFSENGPSEAKAVGQTQ